MKVILTLIFLIQLSFADEIEFVKGSWNDVTAKASADNRLIFVDVFADWCAPCKWMAKNIFTNDSVARFYNSEFINWTIDAEKGEGPDFAKKYQIMFYPTFLFLDASGNVVHKVVGSMPAQDFIAAGKNAADPDKSLSAMKQKFNTGERDKNFLRNYLLALNQSYLVADDVANEYFRTLSENELVTKENNDIIMRMSSPNNDLFRYFAKNTSKFRQFDTEEITADALVKNIYNDYIQSNAKRLSENDLNSIISEVQNYNNPALKGTDLILKIEYYRRNKLWDKFAENVDSYVNTQLRSEENVVASLNLNNYAWAIYENSNNIKLLKKAQDWAKLSVKKDETFYNLDTYASLLYKTGSKEKALTYYKKAVKLAEKFNEDSSQQKEMIKKIEKELD